MGTKIVENIDQFNAYFRQRTLHPLVAVGNLLGADLSLFAPTDFGMYCVVLMDSDFGTLVKDGKRMHYRAGTVFSLRPKQEVYMELNGEHARGWMLAFREELLERSGLGRDFYMFSYFSSDVSNALELSAEERETLLRCFSNLLTELRSGQDLLRDHMLRLNIGLLLTYCKRFFDRQYENLRKRDSGIAERLDMLLEEYLTSGQASQKGQPTVAWCAEQFGLTANYFGDVVRRELHVTARDYIQQRIISTAKRMLDSTKLNVTEIAEELGFTYPNHFTRMFRGKEGISPSDYRQQKSHK